MKRCGHGRPSWRAAFAPRGRAAPPADRCRRRAAPWDDAGTAAVELALLAPLIVALVGMVVFLGDLGVARIRQRAVVRVAAWEITGHALSDFATGRHGDRWAAALDEARATAARPFEGWVSSGLLARARIDRIDASPLALEGGDRLPRPAAPAGFGAVLEALGTLLRRAGGLQLPLLRRWGFNVEAIGVVAEAHVAVEGTGLLPDLPATIGLAPARLALEVDAWALDDGRDVPLPGEGTAFGGQVGRIALFGVGERLRRAGGALDWIPISLAAPVVSMRYGGGDESPVSCGGDDPLARSGRWENGPRHGTAPDRMSPTRCFDTLPIDANGFGTGGGRRADPLWRQLARRGPWQFGCDRPGVAFPDGCGTGGGRWASASSR